MDYKTVTNRFHRWEEKVYLSLYDQMSEYLKDLFEVESIDQIDESVRRDLLQRAEEEKSNLIIGTLYYVLIDSISDY